MVWARTSMLALKITVWAVNLSMEANIFSMGIVKIIKNYPEMFSKIASLENFPEKLFRKTFLKNYIETNFKIKILEKLF